MKKEIEQLRKQSNQINQTSVDLVKELRKIERQEKALEKYERYLRNLDDEDFDYMWREFWSMATEIDKDTRIGHLVDHLATIMEELT